MSTIACRVCGQRFRTWTTVKGKRRNGFNRLRLHFADKHISEYLDLQRKLGPYT